MSTAINKCLTDYLIYVKYRMASGKCDKRGRTHGTRTLGAVSANLISTLHEKGRVFFTIADVMAITGMSNTKASDLTSELIKRNIITRLKPGKYIIIPQEIGKESSYIGNWFVTARDIVNSPDYYISHYSAMTIHNMVTHPVTQVFITTPKQEYRKQRLVGHTIFEFIYTRACMIWGVQKTWVTNSDQVRVSDIERTIIDCLFRPKYCGGIMEVVGGIWMQRQTIDLEKLLYYVDRFKKIVVAKRLGYILEHLGIADEKYLSGLRAKLNEKYYKLDPLLGTRKTYRNSWKLIANISPDEMRKSIST